MLGLLFRLDIWKLFLISTRICYSQLDTSVEVKCKRTCTIIKRPIVDIINHYCYIWTLLEIQRYRWRLNQISTNQRYLLSSCETSVMKLNNQQSLKVACIFSPLHFPLTIHLLVVVWDNSYNVEIKKPLDSVGKLFLIIRSWWNNQNLSSVNSSVFNIELPLVNCSPCISISSIESVEIQIIHRKKKRSL